VERRDIWLVTAMWVNFAQTRSATRVEKQDILQEIVRLQSKTIKSDL
jgi:hypothetical protein